ncbi:MAG: DUF4398 domain-containing protein [Myxococcota bacterium]
MPRQRSVRLTLALLPTLALSVLAAGCGPFGYLKKVAKDATKVVEEAEALDAEKYAPYEYWGAVAYLEQSKVLMAYSEYERSFDYGVRAKQLAEEAIKKSQKMEAGEMKESIDGDDPNAVDAPDADADASGAAADGKASGSVSIGGGK